jgi:hypothetical protein
VRQLQTPPAFRADAWVAAPTEKAEDLPMAHRQYTTEREPPHHLV